MAVRARRQGTARTSRVTSLDGRCYRRRHCRNCQESWADLGERVANLEARLDAQSQDLAEIRESIVGIDDKVEARFAAMEPRFAATDARFIQLESRMDTGFRDIRAEIHTNFRWIMGGIGGAVLAILLGIATMVVTLRL